MHSRIRTSVLALAVCAVATPLASGHITAIFSNVAGQANNAVPTVGGPFQTGVTSTIAFERPFLSPDGSRWIIGAIKEDAADDKVLIITGGGTTAAGSATVVIEDTASPFDALRTWDDFKTNMGILNNGNYAYGGDVSGATADDAVIMMFDGVNHNVIGREQTTPSPVAGQNIGATNDAVHIINGNVVRYRTTLNPTTTKQLLISGAASLAETDVTSPGGQLVAPPQTLDALNVDQFSSSADGAHHIWAGDLNVTTTSDGIVVVDGNVVAQEGAELPGGVMPGVNAGIIPTAGKTTQMSHNGSHWATRLPMADGTGATATDVVLRNGAIAAKTNSPIFIGSTDVWDDTVFTTTFFMNAVSDSGDMVVGGLILSADATKDAQLVYLRPDGTGFTLIAENDPVDLDGNGLLDDNAFVDTFGDDDGTLTSSGQFYFVASLRDQAGTDIGNAFLTLAVPEPGSLSLLAVAALAAARRRRRD